MTLELVAPDGLAAVWHVVEPLLAKGLSPAEGELDVMSVHTMLTSGEAWLIVKWSSAPATPDWAMAVQFLTYPNYRLAHVLTIGGQGATASKEEWERIKDWMRRAGARKVQGVCKPSRARLWRRLGFRSVYETVRQDL